MDKQDFRRWATEFAWATGTAVVIALLVTAPGSIPKWSVVAVVVLGGLAFSLGVTGRGLIRRPKSSADWVAAVGIFVLIWGPLIGLGRAIWPRPLPHTREPRLELYYLGERLDGQTVVLKNRCLLGDRNQREMCVDPNYPDTFISFGVSVSNEGDSPAEVQRAYLDFSSPVFIPPTGSSYWQPNNPESTEFFENWNNMKISPKEPNITVNQFYGRPLPPPDGMHVRLRMFYGEKTAEANFRIKPPAD